MSTRRDEPLEEIWAARRRIAERFGFDPHKQARQLRHRQEEARERIYRREHDMPAASQTTALRETPPDQKPE